MNQDPQDAQFSSIPLLILPSVTSLDTNIAQGSTNCDHDALCKTAPGHTDGFTCTRSSTLAPNPCDILQTLYDRWGSEAKVLSHLLKEVGEILEAAQVTRNATSQLLAGLEILRGRQAVSGTVQVSQVLMFLAYFLTIFVVYMVKYCQEARARHQTQEFELIEARLLERRSKRRIAASRAKSISPQE